MHLHAGRPDIYDTLQGVIAGVRAAYSRSRSGSSDVPSGVVIGSCGPTALMDDAVRAVGRVSWADWKDVGGVESIEEYACSSTPPVVVGHLNEFHRQGVWVVKSVKFFLLISVHCRTASNFDNPEVFYGRDECPVIIPWYLSWGS
jgi:hypothetical protein